MEVAATTPKHEQVPQLRFPPGFRFVPTEFELVDVYLRAKIEGRKLRLHVVNDVSILDWQPGRLVEEYKGYGENRWFFFAVREQSSSNKEKEPSRKVRVDGVTATWKATGSVQLIRRATRSSKHRRRREQHRLHRGGGGGDGDDGVVVGSKRVLIYNSSDADEDGKWSMHEYILEGHAEIGQYALYSIQRKQHSDTDGNADMMDPEKKTNKKKTGKRKRTMETETPPSTELDGLQPPHPETTALLAEPPLKLARKKAKAQRKKKPSMQAGVEGEQQQGQSSMEPVTPPKKDELVPSSAPADGAPAPVVFSAVPLQAIPVLPPSELYGTLGAPAPAPMTEEYTPDDDISQLLAVLLYNHSSAMPCNDNQGQLPWPPSFTDSPAATFLAAPAPDTNVVVDHHLAPFLPFQQQQDIYDSLFPVQQNQQHLSFGENQSGYMEQGCWQWQHTDMFLMDDTTTTTTQPMNSSSSSNSGWDSNHGRQIHHHQKQQQQQEGHINGGAFGVVEDHQQQQQQQPMNHHPQGGGHDDQLPPSGSDEQSSGSDDRVSDMFGESVQIDELDVFVREVLRDPVEPPQNLAAASTQEQQAGGDEPAATPQAAAGTQEQEQEQEQGAADDAATLKGLQHDEQLQAQFAWLRLQRALNQHVQVGPCSCTICAEGLWHLIFPGA